MIFLFSIVIIYSVRSFPSVIDEPYRRARVGRKRENLHRGRFMRSRTHYPRLKATRSRAAFRPRATVSMTRGNGAGERAF